MEVPHGTDDGLLFRFNEPHDGKIFQKLLELKEKYAEHARKIGTPTTPANISLRLISSEDEKLDSGEEYDEEDTIKTRSRAKRKSKETPSVPSVSEIQDTIKTIILENGGSCHLATIVEHIQSMWQRKKVRKLDGKLLGHADCKRLIFSAIRTRSNGRAIFCKDRIEEGCWTLTPNFEKPEEDPTLYKCQPLTSLIAKAVDFYDGTAHFDEILKYILENWQIESVLQTKIDSSKIEHLIRICLATNPLFQEDPDQQSYYELTTNKKKKSKLSSNSLDEKKAKSKNAKEGKATEEEEASGNKESRLRSRKREFSNTVEPGCVCQRCGATSTESGRPSQKWKKGPSGEWLCYQCGLQYNKKHVCPVCGKIYRKNEEASDDEDSNSWIRCDDCHRWVMTKCDNIDDLSLYDDSNPDHLHYSCPVCRGEIAQLISQHNQNLKKGKRFKGRSKRNNLSSDDERGGRIENVEKELLDKFEESTDFSFVQDNETLARIYKFEQNFFDDISQYTTQLIGQRNREFAKNQSAYERQLKKLKEEKEANDHEVEAQLSQDLIDYFNGQKRELEKQIQSILKTRESLFHPGFC